MSSPVLPEDSGETEPTVIPKRRLGWRMILRNTALISILTLILVEIILRALGVTNPVLYMRDSIVGYRLKPSQDISYFGNSIKINDYGVRDPRALKQREENKKRVLVLGDSVTWGGILLAQDELFTAIAEAKLRDVEVINAGVNGYSVNQMAALYENHLRLLNPDQILICVIPRDFERPPVARLSGRGIAFPVAPPMLATAQTLAILRHVLQDKLGWGWLATPEATIVEEASEAESIERNTHAIQKLEDGLAENCGLSVVFLPSNFTTAEIDLRTRLLQELRQRGIHTVDLGQYVDATNEDFIDRVHLSSEGHEKVGRALVAVVRELHVVVENSHAQN